MAKKYLDESGIRYLWGKVKALVSTKQDAEALSAVATSGKYSDLTGVPTSLPADGGNSATVGGYKIISSSTAPTVDDKTVITFVVDSDSAIEM